MKRKNLARVNLSDPNKPKLDFVSLSSMQSDLRDFKDGARVWVEVSTYYRTRTLDQNSLMHAYFQEIADQSKMHPEKVKAAMKAQFLTVPVLDDDDNPVLNKKTGELLMQVKDTSELTTIECAEFCENIRLFAMDFGIYLKEPGEQEELKFTNIK